MSSLGNFLSTTPAPEAPAPPTRQVSRAKVLSALRRHRRMTSTRIREVTGLGRGVVQQLLHRLVREGVVIVVGTTMRKMAHGPRKAQYVYALAEQAAQCAPKGAWVMEGQTHYEGCWRHRGHHRCAIALVNTSIAEAVNLRARLTECEAALNRSNALLTQAEQEIERLRAQVIPVDDRIYALVEAQQSGAEYGSGHQATGWTHEAKARRLLRLEEA